MDKRTSHFYKYFKKHSTPVNYKIWLSMVVVCSLLIVGEFVIIYHQESIQNKFGSDLKSLQDLNSKINHLQETSAFIGDVYYDISFVEDKRLLLTHLEKYDKSFNNYWNEIHAHEMLNRNDSNLAPRLLIIIEQKNILTTQIQNLLKDQPKIKLQKVPPLEVHGRYHAIMVMISQMHNQIQDQLNMLMIKKSEEIQNAHQISLLIGFALLAASFYVGFFGIYIGKESLSLKDLLIQQSFALDQSAIVAITDQNGIIQFANDNFLEVTGYSERELIGQNVKILNSGKHSREFFQNMWTTVTSGKIWKGEVQNKRKNNSLYWVDTSIVPMRKSSADKIDGYIVIRYDITDKKAIQEDLEESQKRLQMALKASGLGVLEWNIITGEFIWSKEFAELLQFSTDGLVPSFENFISLIHPDDRDKIYKAIEEHLTLAKPLNCEIQIQLKDETYRWFQFTGQCEWTKDRVGLPERLLGGIRDVNDLVLSRKEIVEARVLAERSNQLKSSFLANMSHEIRTPMNAIIGMADLLSDTPLTTLQKKYVDIFQKSGESLLLIINDVLDISKIESGYLKITQEGCDLRESVEEVVELVKIKASTNSIYVKSFIDSNLETAILGDPLRIRQILVNIVGNGVKFTRRGGVLITVKNNIFTNRQGNILFTVRDSGMGISAEHLGTLFLPFIQGDSSVTKKFGGTGLGLALSKYLVEMMGGEIWVESEVGKGTVFYFTLNVEHAPKNIMNELKIAKEKLDDERRLLEKDNSFSIGKPLNILLVDDSENNRLIVKAYLNNTAHQIVEAENGEEAITKFKLHNFDLIFMDIQMPILDGISATRYIRHYEKEMKKKPCVIIALTAYAQEDDERRFMEIGCDMHLPKPIQKSTFQTAMKHASILLPS